MKQNTDRPRRSYKGLGFALVLIIIGKIFLLANLGFFSSEYMDLLFSWPMILMLFGLIAFVKLNIISTILFFSVGGFFLIPQIGLIPNNFLGAVPADFTHTYWPVLLIIAGICFAIKSLFSRGNCCKKSVKKRIFDEFKEQHENPKDTEGSFNKNCAFGSAQHIVLDPIFKGGEVNTAFGETILDLRKTNLAEGITNLEIKLIFGSVQIFVPVDWNIDINVNPVFGVFEDKRKSINETPDKSKTLVIYGNVVSGSAELKN